jgi:hypothetical protein
MHFMQILSRDVTIADSCYTIVLGMQVIRGMIVLEGEIVLEYMHPYDCEECVSYFCNVSGSSLAINCFNCSEFYLKWLYTFNVYFVSYNIKI